MNIDKKGNHIMTQMNSSLQASLSSVYSSTRTTSLNKTFKDNSLADLKNHICYLEELNERLKYMMAEIRFLITDK